MPKLKTKKGTAKRFRLTKTGKLKYSSGGKSHLATNKQSEHLRRLRKKNILTDKKKVKYIKRLLPYG